MAGFEERVEGRERPLLSVHNLSIGIFRLTSGAREGKGKDKFR